ncbi:MAG: Dolichyl-phosphate-mannose-protein mannosyltransferase [Candidatus Parcubacteria bacterium]|nr:Dolichyl-phosphate-mannose-protein mannosyltransferase [Candidatus Parcubacteria bacterium]
MNTNIFSQKIVLVGLFILAIFFSLYRLSESPSVWYDEGWYIQTAANWLHAGVDGIQAAPGDIRHVSVLSVGYPLLYPLAVWFKLFGMSIESARALMAVFIFAFVLTAYMLARRLFGPYASLGSLALLATFPPLYGNGKSVLGEVPGLFYLTVFLACLIVGMESKARKPFWFIVSGISIGLCVTTKPVFLLLLPAILVGLYANRKQGTVTKKDCSLAFLGFSIPVIIWALIQFPQGSSSGEVLAFYANPYNFSDILGVIAGNAKRLFSDIGPLYTVAMSGVWAASLFIRRRMKVGVSLAEIIAFSFSILVILAYLRTAGVYRYLFYAQGVALIFFPQACAVVCSSFAGRIRSLKPRWVLYGPAVIVGALSAFGLYQLMFDSWVADGYASHKTAYWEQYLAQVPASTEVFFYDVPEVVPFMGNDNYRQALRTPAAHPFAPDQVSFLKAGQSDMVITTTAIFHENKDGIFERYALNEEAYKYSILKKKP